MALKDIKKYAEELKKLIEENKKKTNKPTTKKVVKKTDKKTELKKENKLKNKVVKKTEKPTAKTNKKHVEEYVELTQVSTSLYINEYNSYECKIIISFEPVLKKYLAEAGLFCSEHWYETFEDAFTKFYFTKSDFGTNDIVDWVCEKAINIFQTEKSPLCYGCDYFRICMERDD